jgi:hypothetical protein
MGEGVMPRAKKLYPNGTPIPGFKAGQGMIVGKESTARVPLPGSAKPSVVFYHVTCTTKTEGSARYINHFHVTFESNALGKLGQFNHTVNNGTIGAAKWGGNGVALSQDAMTILTNKAAAKASAMKSVVGTG